MSRRLRGRKPQPAEVPGTARAAVDQVYGGSRGRWGNGGCNFRRQAGTIHPPIWP